MKRIQLIVIFLSLVFSSFSQRSEVISVKWSDTRATNIGGKEFLLPVIEDQEYNAYLPNIYYRIPLRHLPPKLNICSTEMRISRLIYLIFKL